MSRGFVTITALILLAACSSFAAYALLRIDRLDRLCRYQIIKLQHQSMLRYMANEVKKITGSLLGQQTHFEGSVELRISSLQEPCIAHLVIDKQSSNSEFIATLTLLKAPLLQSEQRIEFAFCFGS